MKEYFASVIRFRNSSILFTHLLNDLKIGKQSEMQNSRLWTTAIFSRSKKQTVEILLTVTTLVTVTTISIIAMMKLLIIYGSPVSNISELRWPALSYLCCFWSHVWFLSSYCELLLPWYLAMKPYSEVKLFFENLRTCDVGVILAVHYLGVFRRRVQQPSTLKPIVRLSSNYWIFLSLFWIWRHHLHVTSRFSVCHLDLDF